MEPDFRCFPCPTCFKQVMEVSSAAHSWPLGLSLYLVKIRANNISYLMSHCQAFVTFYCLFEFSFHHDLKSCPISFSSGGFMSLICFFLPFNCASHASISPWTLSSSPHPISHPLHVLPLVYTAPFSAVFPALPTLIALSMDVVGRRMEREKVKDFGGIWVS